MAVGKIKEKYFAEAAAEYFKRLRPYAKIIVEEAAAESFRKESDREKAKREEGLRLAKALEKYLESEIIILDERGKQFSSPAFSGFLNNEKRRIVFVIGGALGLSPEILAKPYRKISLSEMTLPHEMARVFLLEQIYRAATIAAGKTYHY